MTEKKNFYPCSNCKMAFSDMCKTCELTVLENEQNERSKGCEFCDGSERSMLFRIGACAAMNDEVYVSGDAIIIDFGCKAYDTVKIGFCPMCGRKLKGADDVYRAE